MEFHQQKSRFQRRCSVFERDQHHVTARPEVQVLVPTWRIDASVGDSRDDCPLAWKSAVDLRDIFRDPGMVIFKYIYMQESHVQAMNLARECQGYSWIFHILFILFMIIRCYWGYLIMLHGTVQARC